MPADESQFLHKLEAEVERELGMARSLYPQTWGSKSRFALS
jgi:hypothetical protein